MKAQEIGNFIIIMDENFIVEIAEADNGKSASIFYHFFCPEDKEEKWTP